MPDGLRLMPVKAEVTAVNRQIRRHSQFFAGAGCQQGAVIAYTQAEAAFLAMTGVTGSSVANLREQAKFASSAAGFGMGPLHTHLMRIG
jgi:hypothetical protein